jgi:ATPase subunit of ABC transporter with duplicated ATPase domains
MKEFNFKYSDAGDFLFHRPITFQLVGPKRVRVVGRNGAGKSTLMKLWMQFVPSSKNEILGERIGIIQLKTNRVAYLDQNVEVLGDGNCSLLEQFSKLTPHFTETERRIRLGLFIFNLQTTLKRISTLSGGEKMRAALACVLFSEVPPELLILDEPTNNLDIDSVERIESALSNFRGAIVVISHDSKFLETIGAFEELSLS